LIYINYIDAASQRLPQSAM